LDYLDDAGIGVLGYGFQYAIWHGVGLRPPGDPRLFCRRPRPL